MSNLEQDLRDMLAQRAAASPTNPGDWQDLTVRMARRNRRSQRMMAGALALVLLVGPLAGFAIARAVEEPDTSGRVTAGAPTDGSGGSGPITIASAEAALRAQVFGVGVIGGQPVEKIFRRTTDDGVDIRAFLSRFGATNQCQGDGWCPPAVCSTDASIVGEMSTDAAVGVGTGQHFTAIASPLKVTGGGVFGTDGEGSPTRWTIAQATDKVAKVRVSYDGGGSDEMVPVDGVVLLAARTDTEKPGGTVEALDGSGSVLDHATATLAATFAGSGTTFTIEGSGSSIAVRPTVGSASGASDATTTTVPAGTTPPTNITTEPVVPPATVAPSPGDGAPLAACTPPPATLPAPGAQPADAAAARAQVEAAFATAYNQGLGSDQAKRDAVEDSDALKDVMTQITTGSFAQQVKDASAKVTDVVFTSPTEAAVRYDIDVNGSTTFSNRIGRALLLDGRWKVARVTVCADIALASGTCPAKK